MAAVPEQQKDVIPVMSGHQGLMDRMHSQLAQNRLHHGWLISGPQGIGKFRLARQIAAWVLSQEAEAGRGLFDAMQGEQRLQHPASVTADDTEARLVFSGTHPDLLVIQPEMSEKNRSGLIKTEQVRQLSGFFAHSAARQGWRVAIIDSLDMVNRNGMNAMLKTLEEPPENCLLMLLCSRPARLLPTIRSRCLSAPLRPLSIEETKQVILQLIPDMDRSQLELCCQLSDGAPGRALQLADGPVPDLFTASCHLICDENSSYLHLIELAEKWSAQGKNAMAVRQAAFYLFEALVSVAAMMAGGASPQRLIASQPAIRDTAAVLAARHSAEALAAIHHDFLRSVRISESLYLDFVPVLTKFFSELHSQSRKN